MRSRGYQQEREKATADTVTFQDTKGRCLTPFTIILAHFAQKAKLAFPKANGRVERALEIVQDARNVREQGDYTTFLIRSQNGGGWYMVTAGGCTCKDHEFGNVCKHQVARWLVIRAQQAEGTRPRGEV